MPNQVEKAERAVSALMRLGISAVMPLWAVVMVVLGIEYRSLWWLGTGVVVGGVGVLFLAGSPIASLIGRER
jgi:hypothetical protein